MYIYYYIKSFCLTVIAQHALLLRAERQHTPKRKCRSRPAPSWRPRRRPSPFAIFIKSGDVKSGDVNAARPRHEPCYAARFTVGPGAPPAARCCHTVAPLNLHE